MNVYTGYFYKYSEYIKKGLYPISISLNTPPGINCNNYIALAPTWNILNEYKHNGGDRLLYSQRYNNEILAKLSADSVINDLKLLSGDKDVILLCYEKPFSFCHRQLVAKWLENNGFVCREY